jgi:hypothetical protein
MCAYTPIVLNVQVLGTFLVLLLLREARCFLPGRQGSGSVCRYRLDNRIGLAAQAESSQNEYIYIVKWDGCFADTRQWRIQTGMKVAAATWPEVENTIHWDDAKWLENKLSALSHVIVQSRDDISATCEYAIATRLLLEEQELDGGRSNGKGGKYCSKFHPTHSASETKVVGSRPLTVGEIEANWAEGAMIRETLQIRYHCSGKDPISVLQENLRKVQEAQSVPFPTVDSSVEEAFASCRGKLVLAVSHPSDIQAAEFSLTKSGFSYRVVDNIDDALLLSNQIALVVSSGDTTSDILRCSPSGATVYVLESSWPTLCRQVDLFGDSIPRQGNIGNSIFPDKRLSLSLASWSSNSHATQHAAATMNTWTGLIGLADFKELVSAIIVAP